MYGGWFEINQFVWVIGILLIAGGLVLIHRTRSEHEDYLIIKLIGYYLLGGFRFVIAGLPTPVGFLVYVLFMKPKINRKAKTLAAYLGLTAFILGSLLPPLANSYSGRTREVFATQNTIPLIEFNKDWNSVRDALQLPADIKLNRFDLQYNADGNITEFDYELVALVKGEYMLYKVNFAPSSKVYLIKPVKVAQWLQFPRLVQADRFFEVLDNLDFVENRPHGQYEGYGITSDGAPVSYGIGNRLKYFVSDGKLSKVHDEELPIEGYWICTYGNKKISENSTEGTGYIDYLFR